VEMVKNDDGTARATVYTTKTVDGNKVQNSRVYKGTEEEVMAEVEKIRGEASEEMKFGDEAKKEVKVKMEAGEDGMVKATVTTTMMKDGKEEVTEKVLEGTEEEVMQQLDAMKEEDGMEVKAKIVKEVKEVKEN